jgi:hypothetical protein
MTGTNETVADLSVVTPDIAREVWESFERSGRRPTARAVALAIAQSGKYLPVSYRTIARWAKNNWRPQLRLVKSHPLREAAKKVDASVPVLTGDPMIRASDVAGASGFDVESLHHELLSLSDDDLIRRASRELFINAIVLLEHIQPNARKAAPIGWLPSGPIIRCRSDGGSGCGAQSRPLDRGKMI